MKTRTLTADKLRQLMARRVKLGIPPPRGRRKRLTIVLRTSDNTPFSTRCDYCGGWWKVYQNPHHDLPDCPMK